MVCGNITGNASDPVRTTLYDTEPMMTSTGILHITETEERTKNSQTTETVVGMQSMVVYLVSISSLATALIVCVAIFTTVVVVISKKSKAKIKAALESSNKAEEPTQMESVYYEEITGPVRAIDTQDNIAYSITKTSTAAM